LILKNIKKYYKLGNFERNNLIKALLTSIKVRILIKFFSTSFYANKIGKQGINTSQNTFNENTVKTVLKNVKRVSKYSFWRTNCFEEALTTKLLLKKLDIESTIYFGVLKNEQQKLKAHAWLKIGDKFIIGQKNSEKFTITNFFT
jgi:hypothetical protein